MGLVVTLVGERRTSSLVLTGERRSSPLVLAGIAKSGKVYLHDANGNLVLDVNGLPIPIA